CSLKMHDEWICTLLRIEIESCCWRGSRHHRVCSASEEEHGDERKDPKRLIGPSLVIRRRTRGISRGRAAAGGCMPVLGAKSGAEIRHRCVPHVVLLALRPELQ